MTPEEKVQEKIMEIKKKFPYKFNNDLLLYLNGEINVEHDDIKRQNKYYLDLIDQYGYKYYLEKSAVIKKTPSSKSLNRFFKRNKYTLENINLFCKLNNLDLQLNINDLKCSGIAREKLPFVNSDGNILYYSWNQVQHYTFQFKDDYDEIKKQNKENRMISKEKAASIIIEKEKELGRPLLQTDFEHCKTTDSTVGIRVIGRLWGTFSNMIQELGLKTHDCYYRPNDPKFKTHEEILLGIKHTCEHVKSKHRSVVMYRDLEDIVKIDVSTIKRHCELDGITLKDFVEKHDCKLQKSGCGMNYVFEDGEKVVSKYEYDFSNFLRENGFIYNQSYFRNVYYKDIDSIYKGNMNCDYCVKINNNNIYFEIAGILGNDTYQLAYINNTPIKSKSKEEYRQKLNLKKEIFERNNLEYFILLPMDMTIENYKKIFERCKKKAA